MLKLKIFFIQVLILFSLVEMAQANEGEKPVLVGGHEDNDPCAYGEVIAKNFIYLKSAPSKEAKNIAELKPNQGVFVCDATSDGQWIGVVIRSHPNETCGVSSPIKKRQQYHGNCKPGWLETRQVKILAG